MPSLYAVGHTIQYATLMDIPTEDYFRFARVCTDAFENRRDYIPKTDGRGMNQGNHSLRRPDPN